jgi:hypothetical protein
LVVRQLALVQVPAVLLLVLVQPAWQQWLLPRLLHSAQLLSLGVLHLPLLQPAAAPAAPQPLLPLLLQFA